MISIDNKLTHSRILGTNKQTIHHKSGSLLFDREYKSVLIPIAKSRTKYPYSSSGFGDPGTTKTLLAPGQTFSSAHDFVNAYPFTLESIMKMISKKMIYALSPNPSPVVGSTPPSSFFQPTPPLTITPDGSPESDIIVNAMSEYQPFNFSFSLPAVGSNFFIAGLSQPDRGLPLTPFYLPFTFSIIDTADKYKAITGVTSDFWAEKINILSAYQQRQLFWNWWLALITNFNAYSQPIQTQFSEYFVSNVAQDAPYNPPNSIAYYIVHDAPPAPDGTSFNPAPNTVEFWSLFFTYPEGLDFLSTAALKGPRGFQVNDTVFSQVPSSENITDTPQYTKYDFMLGMNDFTIKTYPGNRIHVYYNRDSKSESVTVTKSKESFFKYVAMAVAIAIVSAMVVAIVAPAAFSSLVGANSVSAAANAAAGTTGAVMSSSTPALTLATSSGGGLASIGAAPTLGSFAVTAPVLSTSAAIGASSVTLLTSLGTIGLTVAKTLGPQILQGMLASKPVINTQQQIPAPSTQVAPSPPSNAITLNSSTLVYDGQSSSGQSVYSIILPNGNSLNVTLSRQLQPNEISSAYLTPIACNDDSTKQCYSFVVPNIVTINDNTYSAQSQPAQPQQSIATTPITQPSLIPYTTTQPTVLPSNYTNPSVLPSNYSQPSVIPSAIQTNAPTAPTTPTAIQAGMLGGSIPLLLIGGIVIFFLFGLKKPKQSIIEKTQTTNKEQK